MDLTGNGISHLLKFIRTNPDAISSISVDGLVEQMETALAVSPHEDPVRADYASFLIDAGRIDRALEVIHQLIDAAPTNYHAHYLLARCHYQQGSLREAQYPIIKCLELQPNYDEGRFLLGKIFFKARQYEKAQKLFEYYQGVVPFERRSEVYVSKCYYYSGGSESAAVFSDGLAKKADIPRPFMAMIYAYQLSNIDQYDRAFSTIYDMQRREGLSPEESAILRLMEAFLLALSARGDSHEDFIAEAGRILADRGIESLAARDRRVRLYLEFARTIHSMKRRDYSAMNLSAAVVRSFRDDYFLEDHTIFDHEEFENIINLARLQSERVEIDRLNDIGCMHINAGNYNAGVRYLESAREKAPRDAEILNRLGEAYILVNQINQALAAFEAIKKIDKDNIEAYRRVSEIYLSTGMYEKFISECRSILALDPADHHSRFYIGEYLFKNSNLAEADEFLRYLVGQIENELKSQKPSSVSIATKELYEKASFILAQIAFKENSRENAILYLNNVISINPENEKAYDLLNKLKQSRQDREVMLLLREADEKENENDLTAAMHVFENVIDINPQFIEAHYRLARNLMKQNNLERALFELERIFDYNCKGFDKVIEVHLLIALIAYELSKIDRCREALAKLSEISSDGSMALMLLYLHKASFLIFGNSPDFNAFLDGLVEARAGGSAGFMADFSLGYTVFNVPKWTFEDPAIFEMGLDAARSAYEADPADIYAAYTYAYALEKSGELYDAYQRFRGIADMEDGQSPQIEHTRRKYALINMPQSLSVDVSSFVLPENLKVMNFVVSAAMKVAQQEERQGGLEGAVHYFNKAARLAPDSFTAAARSVELFLSMSLADKTSRISKISSYIKSLKRDISSNDSRADIRFRLGYLYFKLPDDLDVLGSTIENVVMELKHCISVDNRYLPPYSALREVYEKMGATNPKMYATAVETMKKAFDVIDGKNPFLNVEMGNCYYYFYGQDMKHEALEYYKKAIFYRSDLSEAHFRLASIYRIKKDYEKAILHYGIVYDLEPNGPYAEECAKSMATLKRRHMIE